MADREEIFDLPMSCKDEFLEMICGKFIGKGMSREVYEYKLDTDYVVKFETTKGTFQNVYESMVWDNVEFTEWADWFAPVHSIGMYGGVLIMRKTKPWPKSFPDKMPAFFTDFKKSNYGEYNGRLVCHDYGTCNLITKGLTKRMNKVYDWWDT